MKELSNAVEKHKQLIYDVERYIWENPELGYKEFKTSEYMAKTFKDLGYELVMADGITGFYTVIDTKKPGPEVLILAELDAVVCSEHKDAYPETGAVHACGHNAQCAALVGIAAALAEPGILDKFCGKIRLCAVPAEELLEIEYRAKLKKEGKIKYFGGKSEFLSRGYFDGVDIAFMVHTSSSFSFLKGNVGCVVKQIIYKGVAAHAGGAPWAGKNALYAATCGINAVNAIRETFKESDLIRVHPIITNGGEIVNAIPESVSLESYVRGVSFESICNANKKVNRALTGAALSIGVNVDIIDMPGYSPVINDNNMSLAAAEAVERIMPEYEVKIIDSISSGSTDMGDLSCIMPTIHAYGPGAEGKPHGNDYKIKDPYQACVQSAKMQLGLLMVLLEDGAKRAKFIIDEHKPLFSDKKAFLEFVDSLNSSGDRIDYSNEYKVSVNIE